jgi:hypothetical protein
VSSHDDRTGTPSGALDRIQGPLDLARAWAGGDRLALIVSGSHAAGEAVWVSHAGRSVSLSDLDLYAVVPDLAAKRAALARARAARAGLGERLLAMGLAAPLEVGFQTPADLAALPARPGTLALRRTGRVVDGDRAWLASVPAWSARDVSAEEIRLLLENRGFELLWAAHEPADPGRAELVALARRHAVLKCALELAAVLALAAGEYPERACERVAWARPRWDRARSPEPPWEEALAWREGRVAALAPGAARDERRRTVAAWVAVWRWLAGVPADPADPFAAVRETARRAPLRRRLSRALGADPREACLAGPLARVRHARAGTPWHRLNAAAAAVLIVEAERDAVAGRGTGEPAALEHRHREVLRTLGFAGDPARAGEALVRAWDRCILDGQRTERWP